MAVIGAAAPEHRPGPARPLPGGGRPGAGAWAWAAQGKYYQEKKGRGLACVTDMSVAATALVQLLGGGAPPLGARGARRPGAE